MTSPDNLHPSKRFLWLTAGWICFTVGLIGVVLPGLPTTGPMLLALACFSKGSARLHDWLLHHRFFGPPLRRWQETRTIPLRVKATALLVMSCSVAASVFLVPLPIWAIWTLIGLVLIGAIVILRIPHKTD